MVTFKCKMCGGALEINSNETVAICEYCGTQQTLPKLDDDKRANMYDRANHFRRNNEFDKAMGIYEQILDEDNTDAEAYWSLVLCRYGIEYVEDPTSHKRIPTVNRAQFTSIFDDDNYKSALQYADGYQRNIYEKEAREINEIQKGILSISQKEEPFDVFICYKETDNSGKRTVDSVLANDLYHQLTNEGFKVFFARITLEDKLGSSYEPYIFAALNSAKVMVVLGTKPEFFKAAWVRNEWSRYLALIKQGQKKMLIPAYKDMDPYDLPEEFSHLQAQDMSKLGFMQDLIRGIKKITLTDEPQTTVVKETVVSGGNVNVSPLLKRVFMFLEDRDFASADEYCEKVLDIEPENAFAYLGKLMAELKVKTRESLKDCAEPFDDKNNYQKVIRFADDKLKADVIGYIEHINARNEKARLNDVYQHANKIMSAANTENDFKEAGNMFESICEYRDSAELAKICYENAENAAKDAVLSEGKANIKNALYIWNFQQIIKSLKTVSGWKDADEQIEICQKRIEELKAEKEAKEEAERLEKERQAKKAIIKKRILAIMGIVVIAVIACAIVYENVILPMIKYNAATELMEAGNVVEAYEALIALDGYKDSADKANSIFAKYEAEKLKNAEVGNYVFFGSYEQDNVTSNGKEDIEWKVLEKSDGKILVISKYALDCQPYHTKNEPVTWETCTLRRWLNDDFINAAFTKSEQKKIPTVTVSADENPNYDTSPGKATQDKVFLLSIAEANKYFTSDSLRKCKATDYAVSNGAIRITDSLSTSWWLRSPGHRDNVATVQYGGNVYLSGMNVNAGYYTVRPALWIDLNA